MTKLELESYTQMSPQAMRRWLVGSCVAACSVAAALIAIAASNYGDRLNAGPGPGEASETQLSSAAPPR
jgi:hypothetical protein